MTPQLAKTYYSESQGFLQERKRRQVQQLVLLNNLQRGDQNIASTLLLTLFDRVLSNLYDDKIQVKFLPSQGITQDQLNSYNILAQSDYQEMQKRKLDYDWVWDALFFGRGYCETLRFNKKRKIMEPHVINPLVFGYDPYFEEPQQWRYYWKWLTKSKWELEKLIKKGALNGAAGITKTEQIPTGIDPNLWDYKVRRDAAKKAVEPPMDSMNGDVFQILEMFAHDDKGNRCVYWYDRDISMELMVEKLDLQDAEDGDSKWPIAIKETFREPHSSVNFSVADLLEDKHRAKSVLLNLAFLAAKDRANPLYWYNENVKDVTQFMQRQVNQHIPLEGTSVGDGSVGPINTEDPMSAGLLQFISLLTTEANEPVGAGLTMQPQSKKGDPTATESAISQQMNDMAQSLMSKVIQFGEEEFWSAWFHRYAKNAKALGTKFANIVGVKGVDSSEIDLKDFNTDYPPGVMVYSAKEAEYKELVVRRDLMQLYPQLATTLDPSGMRNFNKFVFFPKFLQDPSLIDTMLPKTLDEIKAEGENEQLAEDAMPEVAETDDHETHLYTHMMVQPKTWATWFHMTQHEEMLAVQKKMQQGQGGPGGESKVSESISFKDLPPQGQVQMAAQAGIKLDEGQITAMQEQQKPQPNQLGQGQKVGGGAPKPKVSAEQGNPMAAATPLKQAINPQNTIR